MSNAIFAIRGSLEGEADSAHLNLNRYIGFTVAQDRYIVPLTDIVEIITTPKITAIPDAPAHLTGVINVRGLIVPVLDLAQLLGYDATATGQGERILITNHDGITKGLLVSSVERILHLQDDDILSPSLSKDSVKTSFICGVHETDSQVFGLLDVTKF